MISPCCKPYDRRAYSRRRLLVVSPVTRDGAVRVLPHPYQLVITRTVDIPVRASPCPRPFSPCQLAHQAKIFEALPCRSPTILTLSTAVAAANARFPLMTGDSVLMAAKNVESGPNFALDVSGVCCGHSLFASLGPPCHSEL